SVAYCTMWALVRILFPAMTTPVPATSVEFDCVHGRMGLGKRSIAVTLTTASAGWLAVRAGTGGAAGRTGGAAGRPDPAATSRAARHVSEHILMARVLVHDRRVKKTRGVVDSTRALLSARKGKIHRPG